MENQHKHIKGYRDLSEKEISLMNKIKDAGTLLGLLCDELNGLPDLDKRWLSIGKTDLQKGIMSLVRAVAQPESF